jgi:hypothetical protein
LRRPHSTVWADRGKNHEPAAITPGLLEDGTLLDRLKTTPRRYGGLRPALTQAARPAPYRGVAGTKSRRASRTKSMFGLAKGIRLRSGKAGSRIKPESWICEVAARTTEWRSGLRVTAPNGVQLRSALAFISTIEDPKRFRRSTDVGAYLGLVPRVHQSGEIDRMGRITKAGDNLTCSYLVETANVLLTRIEWPCPLREWGLRIRQRAGLKKARWLLPESLRRCCTRCGQTAPNRVAVRNSLTVAFPGFPRGGVLAGMRAGADIAAIVVDDFRPARR